MGSGGEERHCDRMHFEAVSHLYRRTERITVRQHIVAAGRFRQGAALDSFDVTRWKRLSAGQKAEILLEVSA